MHSATGGPRKRIGVYAPTVQGGGGGGGAGDVRIGPNYGEASELGIGMEITRVNAQMQVTDLAASKDSWTDDLAVCSPDTNHNGSVLSIEGVIATKKLAFVGWDVSTYLTGMTVTAATISFELATAPLLIAQTVTVQLIPTGSEGWAETTIVCSNDPASDGNFGSFVVNPSDAVGTVYTVTLDATARARLAARMGVGTFSVRLENTSITGVSLALRDKDASADPATLTFTANKNLSI